MKKFKTYESARVKMPLVERRFEYNIKKYFSKLPGSFFVGLSDREKMIWRALHFCSSGMILRKSKHKRLKLDDIKK